MEDYSRRRNIPSTQEGYLAVIDRNIILWTNKMKGQDVKRSDMAGLMKKLAYKPVDANSTVSVPQHMPMLLNGKATHLISDKDMGRLFGHLERIEAEGLEDYVI